MNIDKEKENKNVNLRDEQKTEEKASTYRPTTSPSQ